MSPRQRKGGNADAEGEAGGGMALEGRLTRLEAIVAALESGDLPLEEGLALFEEGIAHIREAESLLARAELRVQELVGEASGEELRPLDEGIG